ncbi:hypothetical protein JXM67_03405 [candidate division WOR-3 bacterium]|nr:hypothetical protein [candidate division WOR-3 bacterium]
MKKGFILFTTAAFVIALVGCGNEPPVIEDLYADIPEGSRIFASDTVTFICEATDPDEDDELSYNWNVPAGGAFLTPTDSSVLIWMVPAEEGSYILTCVVSDPEDNADSGSLTIDVFVNKRPKIDSITGLNLVTAGDTVLITCFASDEDSGQELSFAWEASGGSLTEPSGASNLSWVAPDYSGVFDLICTVSDGMAQIVDTFTVTVQNYFPLGLGYKWLYMDVLDFVVFVDTLYYKATVVDYTQSPGRVNWSVQRQYFDSAEYVDTIYDTMHYIVAGDSLILDDPNQDEQLLGLLFPLWVGKYWDIGDGTLATVTYSGPRSVPAGLFTDCMFVQLDDEERQPNDYWFAPDIGMVQVGVSLDTVDLVFELTDSDLH